MSTLTKYTADSILQIISDLRGESAINTDAVRLRAIDRAVGDFSTRRFWSLYSLVNQTKTSTGVNDYEIGSATYPYRPKGLSEIFVGGTTEFYRYTIVNESDFLFQFNQNNADKLAYEWYDVANDAWKIHINPDTSGDTITYSYYWQAPAVTSTSSAVYTPDPDIIARRALAYLYEGEDEDKYTEMYQLSEQMANSWDQIEDTPNVGQTQTMVPPHYKGFGDY